MGGGISPVGPGSQEEGRGGSTDLDVRELGLVALVLAAFDLRHLPDGFLARREHEGASQMQPQVPCWLH